MEKKINKDKIKKCCVCGVKTEKWVTEIIPNERFKNYCEECFKKIKK
jgi:hypothetical protein